MSIPKKINQRQLRNQSGDVMRGLDSGDSFVVTRNGVEVGELRPIPRRRFVRREVALAEFSDAALIDPSLFRRDLDAVTDQDPTPRA